MCRRRSERYLLIRKDSVMRRAHPGTGAGHHRPYASNFGAAGRRRAPRPPGQRWTKRWPLFAFLAVVPVMLWAASGFGGSNATPPVESTDLSAAAVGATTPAAPAQAPVQVANAALGVTETPYGP